MTNCAFEHHATQHGADPFIKHILQAAQRDEPSEGDQFSGGALPNRSNRTIVPKTISDMNQQLEREVRNKSYNDQPLPLPFLRTPIKLLEILTFFD